MTPTRPPYSCFSPVEHRARLDVARQRLADAGISVCICIAPENLYYYGGYDSWVSVNSPQALVFSVGDDEPTIILRDTDIALAMETSWVRDLRPYRLMADDIPGLVANVAREKGMSDGRVGVEIRSYALPHALGQALEEAVSPARIVDVTDLLGGPRMIKSPAEIDCLRAAGRYAALGIDAARRALRPGITETGLAAAVEASMRAAGSDYWAIPTELASGPRTAGGHATPRDRVISRGDLVHLEFAGVEKRYHAVAIHTMSLGDPGSRAREVYEMTRASLAAGLGKIRAGIPVAEIEEASLEPIRAAGAERAATMRFGYGVGIAYPPIWLEPLQIARGSDQVLETGMVFVLHGYTQFPDEGLGVIVGGTWHLSADGPEMIAGTGDLELDVL